jgi:hypothetical protein
MRRGTIDAIYWRLHSAFLRNERHDAEKFMAMLDDELKGKPGQLSMETGVIHAARHARIRDAIIRGDYGRLRGAGVGVQDLSMPFQQVEPSGAEKDFCWRLLCDPSAMLMIIGASPKSSMVSQLDLGCYGRVDFLVVDGRVRHVVEVKMGEAPTSVVSQVDRYLLAEELDMCLGLHDEVRGAVLAEGFGPYVLGELSRMGVTIIEHRGGTESMRRL